MGPQKNTADLPKISREEVWGSSPSRPLGGQREARGENGAIKKDNLSWLSFLWPLRDLNPRPTDYESAALTN